MLELLARRERRAVHDEIEAAELPIQRRGHSAICSSLVTSHGSTSGFSSFAGQLADVLFEPLARVGQREPGAAACAACAIAQEIERLLATPTIETVLPGEIWTWLCVTAW